MMNTAIDPGRDALPENQPRSFPVFYPLPETTLVGTQLPACNDPRHHIQVDTRQSSRLKSHLHALLRQEQELFLGACSDAWAAFSDAFREMVGWLFRWVVLPIVATSAFWVPLGNPAELPL